MEKPKAMKVAMWLGSIAFFVYLFWQYAYSSRQEEYAKLSEELETLRSQISVETSRVNRLPQLRKDLERLNDLYEIAATKLPQEDEAGMLLGAISNVAKNAGIEAPKFTPRQTETLKDYYAEKLIDLDMRGSFNKVAVFLDELSRLDRIINVEDIVMTNPRTFTESTGTTIEVKGVLKVFRYLRPEERPQNRAADEATKNDRAKRKA